jgi:hypothetical protein
MELVAPASVPRMTGVVWPTITTLMKSRRRIAFPEAKDYADCGLITAGICDRRNWSNGHLRVALTISLDRLSLSPNEITQIGLVTWWFMRGDNPLKNKRS